MKLLLISNSRIPGGKYLESAIAPIKNLLGNNVKKILFIPYAAVDISYDDYCNKVQCAIEETGYQIEGIHTKADPKEAIREAEAILVGGGNTWQLLHLLQENQLLTLISDKVKGGTPYIGWSAGSNIACPTIKTTNDMPIVEVLDMNALNLIPFQINPHYHDSNPDGHGGETREERILEFLEINKDTTVVGLRENTALQVIDQDIHLIGDRTMRVFRYDKEIIECASLDNIKFLLLGK